jgi:hypothetical protein
MRVRGFVAAAWTACTIGARAGALLSNGDFEATRDGWPEDWPHPEHAAYAEEGGNHFVRLTAAGPDTMVTLYRGIAVPAGAAAFRLSFRARCEGVKPGRASWHDARVIVDFKDAAGRKLPGGPGHPSFRGTTPGWEPRSLGLVVPPGAATLEIMPAMFNAAAGTMDIDDVELVPLPLEDAGFVGRKLSEPMPATAGCAAAELVVRGNRIVTRKEGREVWLQGVAVASLEWMPAGDRVLSSVTNALAEWKANAIRLPVKSDFWFGRGPGQKDGGEAYRGLVDAVVRLTGSRGAWVVIDLHEYRAPEQKHADFWRDAATRYGGHPGVIFGLLNEPHGIPWQVWRDGGWVTDKPRAKDGVVAENADPLRKFHSVGMQRLVDVARKTGARNLVSAGGLDWGYDLSGVLEGHALEERGGNGIVYESHVYPWKRDWQKRFLDVAARHPVLIGEAGCQPGPMPGIPLSAHEAPESWAPDMLGCIQKHRLNWTAWCFHPKAAPCLLLDWTYAPTPWWGVPVKAALAGQAFEMKRAR